MPQEEVEMPDADFDSQLRGLFQEAEQRMEDRVSAARRAHEEKAVARPLSDEAPSPTASLPQMLRPVMLGLEALSRAAGENTQMITRLDAKLEKPGGILAEAHQNLPTLVERLETLLEQKNGLNHRMFDALHEELKGYKDGFLLDTVCKPMIRDLIALFDDLAAIHRQMQNAVAEAAQMSALTDTPVFETLRKTETNIQHNCEFIVEVLARLDVTILPSDLGRYDKLTQRAVAVQNAERPDEDGEIVRVVKRGFLWKHRIFRAEEVVLRKWKGPALAQLHRADVPV